MFKIKNPPNIAQARSLAMGKMMDRGMERRLNGDDCDLGGLRESFCGLQNAKKWVGDVGDTSLKRQSCRILQGCSPRHHSFNTSQTTR